MLERRLPRWLAWQYPRLRDRTGAVCTEAFARVHGALLFNRSHP